MNKKSNTITIVVLVIVAVIGTGLIFKYLAGSGESVTTDDQTLASTTEMSVDGNTTDSTATSEQPASSTNMSDADYEVTDVVAPGGVLHVLIADTDAKQEEGLGNRASLAADSGMVFEFATPGKYDFWMKDMKFPLDIVWIDANDKVIGVVSNLSPSTYPDTVSPPSDIAYVLELNAGAALQYDIATGTVLTF